MHDIKFIRNNPEKFEKQMFRRGLNIDSSSILGIDKVIRKKQSEKQVIQEQRNNSSKEIGKLISEGKDVSELKQNISNLKSELTKIDQEIKNCSSELNDILKVLPNSLDDDVPDGDNENENKLIREWGTKPKFSFEPLDHVEIGEKLNQQYLLILGSIVFYGLWIFFFQNIIYKSRHILPLISFLIVFLNLGIKRLRNENKLLGNILVGLYLISLCNVTYVLTSQHKKPNAISSVKDLL